MWKETMLITHIKVGEHSMKNMSRPPPVDDLL